MIDSRRSSPEPAESELSALLAAARSGTSSDVGQLLESTRRYLLLVANRSMDAQLQQKIAPSDLVQETFIDAHRDFVRFTGDSEAELFAWLCQILTHKAADAGRKFRGTSKRNIAGEQPLAAGSSPGFDVASKDPSPSGYAIDNENQRRLEDALKKLPADYREVIELRSLARLSFAEVGRRMGRSDDAAGKLWFRAIQQLREELALADESGYSSHP
jgi:RNA polymerase sigma-70 factor (ECF subfamily)